MTLCSETKLGQLLGKDNLTQARRAGHPAPHISPTNTVTYRHRTQLHVDVLMIPETNEGDKEGEQ